ncbi:C1q-related factor-like [Ruditapes philippinarum]|uniref:C1q-related factor-like n=1 Tax=Ruditapes philippinarum TaxID=129788 RepID=UPI00295B7779|nr:C1q-related factor-like [Ruditapes philippinarum]
MHAIFLHLFVVIFSLICMCFLNNYIFYKNDGDKKDLSGTKCGYEEVILENLLDYNKDVHQMKNEIISLQNQLTEIKQHQTLTETVTIPTIAFSAKDSLSLSPLVGQKFIFKTVLFNYGNGYDNNEGIFTVPTSGTYFFTAQFCVNGNHALHVELVSNGEVLKRIFWSDTSTQCYSMNAIAVLNAGARVWTTLLHSATSLYDSAFWWNSFSGTIVHL